MPDSMKNTITEALPGKRLRPPPAERVNHDIDVVQKNDQRPKASQPIERQNATLAHGHRYPLFNSTNRANSILPVVLQFHKQQ